MKEILQHLFEITDDKASWFAPLQPALDGLTEAEARWKPEWSDHSIAGLTAHLHFYQERELNRFKGIVGDSYHGDNKATFTEPAPGEWPALVTSAHGVLKAWRDEILKADAEKLAGSAGLIAEVSTHLAYHTGQIVLLRKAQGSWNPDKGVL